MRIRQLPVEEWGRLEGHPEWNGFMPDPQTSIVVVAEDEEEGGIIGTWCMVLMPHMEGFWIHPDHRKKSTLPVRLFRGMEQVLRENNLNVVLSWADDDKIGEYIERLGGSPLTVKTYLHRIP